jgi:hypothetical protein
LQKYDIALRTAAHEIDLLSGQKSRMTGEIKKNESDIEVYENKMKANSVETAKLEKDVEFIEEHIKKINDRFLLIKTEKELGKYNSELEKLKADKDAVEEKVIAAMERHEKLTAKIKKLKAELELKKAGYSEEVLLIDEKMAAQKEEVDKLNAHRREFVSGIPAAAVELYDKLMISKNGLAIALVSKKICSGCHLSISDNILSQTKFKTAMVCCPNCQRIIFLE